MSTVYNNLRLIEDSKPKEFRMDLDTLDEIIERTELMESRDRFMNYIQEVLDSIDAKALATVSPKVLGDLVAEYAKLGFSAGVHSFISAGRLK